MSPTFKDAGDTFKPDFIGWSRIKGTHQVGLHGKAKFIATPNTGFTGIFETGCKFGILRLASAVEPNTSNIIAPSMAYKCLRDNVDSANLLAMYNVNGNPDGDWNFFSKDFENHTNMGHTTKTKMLTAKFETMTDF